MTNEQIARVCHEVNRAYCQAIGDTSQVPWEEAPDHQRTSSRLGVGLHLTQPLTPQQTHQSWMDEKLAAGWTYGPVKDADAKTHPCLVPYDQLPAEQRVKDYLFAAVIRTLDAIRHERTSSPAADTTEVAEPAAV